NPSAPAGLALQGASAALRGLAVESTTAGAARLASAPLQRPTRLARNTQTGSQRVQPEFWQERWRTAQIGFHQSAVDRHLQAYWPALKLTANTPVFVPLGGKSLDLLWLRDQGHWVTGIELSAVAVEAFCMENGIPARRRPLGDLDAYEAERLTLLRGDFFKLTPALLGKVSAVYDRASLISWTPALRARYVQHLTALTNPGTQTLLITVEYPEAQMRGPPFPVTRDETDKLYADHYSIEQLGRHEILDLEPRLKARGLTELHEVCYRLIRL
ncbi:MAG: thiopurine S-methyltransferase, partial [Pseudomonadota bacterium]|nr:thiopurine S-methyltransferase [Pseudomonadota bacterium]